MIAEAEQLFRRKSTPRTVRNDCTVHMSSAAEHSTARGGQLWVYAPTTVRDVFRQLQAAKRAIPGTDYTRSQSWPERMETSAQSWESFSRLLRIIRYEPATVAMIG